MHLLAVFVEHRLPDLSLGSLGHEFGANDLLVGIALALLKTHSFHVAWLVFMVNNL